MYNHNKAQQSKNRVHISWDILYYAAVSIHPNIAIDVWKYFFLSCQVIRIVVITFVISISENSVESIQFTIPLSLAGSNLHYLFHPGKHALMFRYSGPICIEL